MRAARPAPLNRSLAPLARSLAPLAVVAALALTGCSAAAPTPTASPDTALTITNCDTRVTFDSAPERVVTIKSTSTELLLALGLGDRIVGTGFQDGPLPDALVNAGASLTSLSDQVPSEEVVLETEPDLVFAGWESNFSPEGVGERAELQALGVNTYVAPAACRSVVPPKLTFADVFAGIQEVADIFRVDAQPLLAAQNATLDAIEPVGAGRTALWYSSGTDTPYVGAGSGAPELVLETVGLENIAGEVEGAWAPLNWEAIVDADPDVIVLVDAAWNTADSKIASLESNPATAELTAVTNGAYLVVPFAASEAGVRTVDAAASLASQLEALPVE